MPPQTPDPNAPQAAPSDPTQQQGGFFSRLGAGLKKVMPYVTPIANRLAAAAGNYGPMELEHQQKEQQLEEARNATQQQLADSQMQTANLNRQLLSKQIENVRTPEQVNAAELAKHETELEQQANLMKPTDVVAPMPEGGYGHYSQTNRVNPETHQLETHTDPTMVTRQVPNPALAAQQGIATGIAGMRSQSSTVPNGQGPLPPSNDPLASENAPPLLMPPIPPQVGVQEQLSAIPKGMTKGQPIRQPDGSYAVPIYNPQQHIDHYETLEGTPLPQVPITTSGSNTVLKDTPQGQVPVELPHSSTKGPADSAVPPTMPGTAARPPMPPGVHAGAPLLHSKQEQQWVSWTDEHGRQVAGPNSMAAQAGAQNPTQVPVQEVRDITNARFAVNLMTKQGDPNKPETQGVLQLLDSLERDGKLGVLASRWNAFMTQRVGAAPGDDPRIVTLINKNMLSDTATMLAHFGASGGRSPQMLQHFLDLANAGKMDGPTLKAGTLAMADYMKDRAMLPGPQGASSLTVPPSILSPTDWLNQQPQKP